MSTTSQRNEPLQFPPLLPGLNHGLAPEQLLVANWRRFHDHLAALTIDQKLRILETGPDELVEFLYFHFKGGHP